MISLKQIQLSINTLFKRLKFFEISNREGKVLISERENELRVGDVLYMRDENGNVTVVVDGEYVLVINGVSYKVKVVGGKVDSIINAEDGSTVEVVTTAVPQQESVQQMKQVAQKGEKDTQKEMPTMSAFETYMYNEYLNDVTMSKYPFDECVQDMKERGYDCPECVCAAIKNRTVAHYIQQGLTIKEAIAKVIDDVTSNETLKYILRKNNEVTNQQQIGIKVEQANQKDEIDELKKEISELKKQMEAQKQEIIKMHSISKSKKERNAVNSEIDEYRKKYFLSNN